MASRQSRRARLAPVAPIRQGLPAPSRFTRLLARAVEWWQAGLEKPGYWLAGFALVGTVALLPSGLVFAPRVEAGAIADRDYLAPEELLVPDEETTRHRQDKAREESQPVYDYDPNPATEAEIAGLFEQGRDIVTGHGESETALSGLISGTHLKLSPEQLRVFLHRNFAPDLEERLKGVASQVAKRGVVLSKEALLEHRLRGVLVRNLLTGSERSRFDLYSFLGYPEGVTELVEAAVRDWSGLSGAERRQLKSFLVENLEPNLHFNKSETNRRQEEAAAAVSLSFSKVRRGQVIARKGDELSPAAVRLIRASGQASGRWQDRALPPLGVLLLLAASAVVAWLALGGVPTPTLRERRRLFAAFLLLLGLSFAGARLNLLIADALGSAFEHAPFDSPRAWAYGVPLAAPAMLAALLLGRQAALVLAALFCLLIARLAPGGDGLSLAIYGMAGSLAAIYGLGRFQVRHRLVMTRLGLLTSAVNMALVVVLTVLAPRAEFDAAQLGLDLVCAFAGGLLVAAVASFALPILEAVLGLTTDIRLGELANTNLPLLRRLAFEAPGTFQHSLMVGHLARQACEVIGDDAPLAYAAGLYHDIGKVVRPDYFVENQRGGANPHDKLQPSMSAQVLIRHIKDGAAMAREAHLPQPLIDAIEQHHGSRLMKYFYNRALETQAEMSPTEEQFRYPGPRPQNRVMGVLMLADAVEAASRTLIEPTEAKLEALIRAIVDDCQSDGQLDETDLTLSDLRRIAEVFRAELATIFHQRIDYPGFDFNRREAAERPRPSQVARRAS